MGRIADRLHELGLALPPPVAPPPGVVLPFAPALVIGTRVVVSGHGPQAADGTVAGPFGKVGAELTIPKSSAPGFVMQPAVVNGFSDLVLEVFGPDIGAHTRSAVGMAELPFGIPVEVEGEVMIG